MIDVKAIVQRRRKHDKYLREESKIKQHLEVFIEKYSDNIIDLHLYMEHYSYESQKVDSIMNFYKIAFKRVRFLLNNSKESKYSLSGPIEIFVSKGTQEFAGRAVLARLITSIRY